MVHELEPLVVQALLDRLDPVFHEPCDVPGCVHLGHAHDADAWQAATPVAA